MTRICCPRLRTFAEIQEEANAAIGAEIQRGISAGMTQAQVAEVMGVSPSKLCRWLKGHGYEYRLAMVRDG